MFNRLCMCICIVLCIITPLILFFLKKIVTKNEKKVIEIEKIGNIPKNIWLYWENKSGHEKPEYIQMCIDSVLRNCGKEFSVTILDENSVLNYLPSLRKDLNGLTIPQKADYIRLAILNKYGGIWLDSDIIVFKSLLPLVKKLKEIDYVGFGYHGLMLNNMFAKNGYGKPANWAMISRKNGILVKKCLENANKLLDSKIELNTNYRYHKLGRELIWDVIKNLRKNSNWDYYHVDSINLERDVRGEKITNVRLMSNEILDPSYDSYFLPLYNTSPGFPESFLNMKKEDILKNNMLVSQLFRKAFNYSLPNN